METAPKGHATSSRKAACLSGRIRAIVSPAGQRGFLGLCLEGKKLAFVLFFPLPSLVGGTEVAARRPGMWLGKVF